MLETIQRFKAKTFVGVPALYRMILEHDRVDFYDLQSLQYCFCAGDVLPIEIGTRWFDKYKKIDLSRLWSDRDLRRSDHVPGGG